VLHRRRLRGDIIKKGKFPTVETNQEPTWRKSTRCGSSSCVEVAKIDDDSYLVRDSKNPDQATLTFTAAEWSAFVAGVQAGDFRFE
jgi:hypothetical protein